LTEESQDIANQLTQLNSLEEFSEEEEEEEIEFSEEEEEEEMVLESENEGEIIVERNIGKEEESESEEDQVRFWKRKFQEIQVKLEKSEKKRKLDRKDLQNVRREVKSLRKQLGKK
jgi:hypothetical protein